MPRPHSTVHTLLCLFTPLPGHSGCSPFGAAGKDSAGAALGGHILIRTSERSARLKQAPLHLCDPTAPLLLSLSLPLSAFSNLRCFVQTECLWLSSSGSQKFQEGNLGRYISQGMLYFWISWRMGSRQGVTKIIPYKWEGCIGSITVGRWWMFNMSQVFRSKALICMQHLPIPLV